MTNPRDQIDEWQGGEVTPLNPPPGSLHQIRRRARQRKTRQAVFAAAGCGGMSVVAIAAGSSGWVTGLRSAGKCW